MSHAAAPPRPSHNSDTDLHRLLELLALLLEGHRRLLACLQEKRLAIRCADIGAISRLCEEEARLAEQLAPIEERRLRLTASIAHRLELAEPPPPDLGAIAERVGGLPRDALLEMADALREVVQSVRRESSIVTAAADALDRHVTGVMQTIYRVVSCVGVYERKGQIAVGSQLDFCVDVRS